MLPAFEFPSVFLSSDGLFTVSLSDSFSDSVVVSFCVSLSVSLSFCASAGILNAVTECGARLYFAVFSVTEIFVSVHLLYLDLPVCFHPAHHPMSDTISEDLFLSGLFRL